MAIRRWLLRVRVRSTNDTLNTLANLTLARCTNVADGCADLLNLRASGEGCALWLIFLLASYTQIWSLVILFVWDKGVVYVPG